MANRLFAYAPRQPRPSYSLAGDSNPASRLNDQRFSVATGANPSKSTAARLDPNGAQANLYSATKRIAEEREVSALFAIMAQLNRSRLLAADQPEQRRRGMRFESDQRSFHAAAVAEAETCRR